MMTYPTLLNYIEAIESLKDRFRTLSALTSVKTPQGMPIYKMKGSIVYFEVCNKTGDCFLLGLFLNHSAKERYLCPTTAKLYTREFFAHNSAGHSDYVDMILQPSASSGVLPAVGVAESDARPVCEGLRAFVERDRWGFKDVQGNVVIDPIWQQADDFAEGRALVQNDELWGLIDKKGRLILPVQYDELSWDGSNYVYGEQEGRWGAFDRSGNTVIPLQWDWVGEFANGYAIIQRGDQYGYVNTQGQVTIEPKYTDASSFNEFECAQVAIDDQIFFIDSKERRV